MVYLGLPINSMVDLSMAMFVITRWYIYKFTNSYFSHVHGNFPHLMGCP